MGLQFCCSSVQKPVAKKMEIIKTIFYLFNDLRNILFRGILIR